MLYNYEKKQGGNVSAATDLSDYTDTDQRMGTGHPALGQRRGHRGRHQQHHALLQGTGDPRTSRSDAAKVSGAVTSATVKTSG